MELIHHLLQDNLTSSLTMAGARGESPLSGSEVDGASSPPGNLDLTGDSVILPQVSINPVNDTVNDIIALRIYHNQLKIV